MSIAVAGLLVVALVAACATLTGAAKAIVE